MNTSSSTMRLSETEGVYELTWAIRKEDMEGLMLAYFEIQAFIAKNKQIPPGKLKKILSLFQSPDDYQRLFANNEARKISKKIMSQLPRQFGEKVFSILSGNEDNKNPLFNFENMVCSSIEDFLGYKNSKSNVEKNEALEFFFMYWQKNKPKLSQKQQDQLTPYRHVALTAILTQHMGYIIAKKKNLINRERFQVCRYPLKTLLNKYYPSLKPNL